MTDEKKQSKAHGAGLSRERLAITVEGVELSLSLMRRDGEGVPILFLHGFGSTKEGYADVARHPRFAGRPVIAYDAPGCGETICADLTRISIPFLVETALSVLRQYGVDRFHLIGHSMGGLVALMLAHRHSDRVLSFVDIEGNVAPEDCFLSRQIVTHADGDDAAFFDRFIERAWHGKNPANALYAASLRHNVHPGAVRAIFTSMIDLSDNGDLMSKFLSLPLPRLFMYGETNASLSYLALLQNQGVQLAEIPASGHWPMYSNPIEMWRRIAAFHDNLVART